MKKFLHCAAAFCLLLTPLVFTGCGGDEGDTTLEYDAAESEQQSKDYEQQMRDAMQQQGRPAPK